MSATKQDLIAYHLFMRNRYEDCSDIEKREIDNYIKFYTRPEPVASDTDLHPRHPDDK